ncbi:MAG: aldose 1-epimerase [Chitinophagaceae bacterium]
MFSVIEKEEDGFHKLVLENDTNRVAIIPNCGAILNAWQVLVNGQWINVIEGYDSEADFRANCENKGFRSCKLSPYVCRTSNAAYSFNEVEYKIGKYMHGHNSLHGLMYDVAFEIVHQQADEYQARVQLEICYPASDPGYPFQYTMMVEYVLQAGNMLTVNTMILNQHEEVIPMADGWHPYFTLGGSINGWTFIMASDTMLEFDERLVPTGEVVPYNQFQQPEPIGDSFFDNSFLLRHPLSGPACTLTNPETEIQLEIFPAASYPILQVYTPPHRNSIAIENLSAAPDAFNNRIGLLYLEPNESKTFSTTFKISAVEPAIS